jgi:hypothetical protein
VCHVEPANIEFTHSNPFVIDKSTYSEIEDPYKVTKQQYSKNRKYSSLGKRGKGFDSFSE